MSNQSDTPETDEVCANPNSAHANFFLMRDHARKLERERDEARKIAEKDRDAYPGSYKLPWE